VVSELFAKVWWEEEGEDEGGGKKMSFQKRTVTVGKDVGFGVLRRESANQARNRKG